MVYWVSLQNMLGYGNTQALSALLNSFGSPKSILEASDEELKRAGLSNAQLKRRGDMKPAEIEKILAVCQKEGVKIIPYSSPLFPDKLRNINEPPVVLYVIGDIPDFDNMLSLAMVGTRSISDYGKRASFSLSARLALGGAIIISGGAVGGDAFAHMGAMAVSGKTVNITGGGVLSDYLKKNQKLRRSILSSGGALISEFPPEFSPNKSSFHIRNRIISGLSDAVIVVEAPIKSGTLITAGTAAEQGRDVYAMPGAPEKAEFEGTNKLISFGAKPIISPKEILLDYCSKYKSLNPDNMDRVTPPTLSKLFASTLKNYGAVPQRGLSGFVKERISKGKKDKQVAEKSSKKPKTEKSEESISKPIVEKKSPRGLSEDCQKVYAVLTADGVLVDTIAEKTELSAAKVLKALTLLEIKGYATALHGSRYGLK